MPAMFGAPPHLPEDMSGGQRVRPFPPSQHPGFSGPPPDFRGYPPLPPPPYYPNGNHAYPRLPPGMQSPKVLLGPPPAHFQGGQRPAVPGARPQQLPSSLSRTSSAPAGGSSLAAPVLQASLGDGSAGENQPTAAPPSSSSQVIPKKQRPVKTDSTATDDSSVPLYQWAQCDRCQKWRRLPGVVDTKGLPEQWFCEMNVWDNSRRSCEAPEEVDPEPDESHDESQRRFLTAQQQEKQLIPKAGSKKSGKGAKLKGLKIPKVDSLQRVTSMASSADGGSPDGGAPGLRGALESDHHQGPRKKLASPSGPRSPSPDGAAASSSHQRPPGTYDEEPQQNQRHHHHQKKTGKDLAPPAAEGAPKRAKPVWNWVQCEKASCRKWRRLMQDVDPESLPDLWVCDMNTWDPRFASCDAPEEDVDDVDAEDAAAAAASQKKLSYRELLFTAEGKLRPPFNERSAITSLFSIGTRIQNGKVHEVEAYETSEYYDPRGRDYHVHNNASTSSAKGKGSRSSLL